MKIAFMGKSGAGKDYLASHLILNYGFNRFSFSDQLKKIAHQIYPWLESDYPPIEKEEKLNLVLDTGEHINSSPREIWLHLNKLREIENLVFIRMLATEIEKHFAQSDSYNKMTSNVLISDIRSTEEFEWCKKNEFTVIYLKPHEQIYENYSIDKHIEMNKGNADLIFENKFNGITDFDEFYQKLDL